MKHGRLLGDSFGEMVLIKGGSKSRANRAATRCPDPGYELSMARIWIDSTLLLGEYSIVRE